MKLQEIISSDSKIMVISPHADDEVLGCGGLMTLAKEKNAQLYVLFGSVAGYDPINGGYKTSLKQRIKELEFVMKSLHVDGYDIWDKEGKYHLSLDDVPIKKIISWLEKDSIFNFWKIKPNIVLIPSKDHNHQDHKAMHEASLSLLRTNPSLEDLLVLEYEIPGTGQTGFSSFNPNFYLEITQKILENKKKLFSLYKSQVAKKPHLRSLHAITSLASFRGLEVGCEYAEAYNLLRMKINIPLTKYERIVKKLYLNEDIGLSDVENRLSINTNLGNFNFEETIAQSLDFKKSEKVLDVGCGTGKHLINYQKKYQIIPYGIDVAVHESLPKEIVFKKTTAENLLFEDNFFDKIMCNYALYYVKNWKKAVEEMIRVSKKNAIILITAPAKKNNKEFYNFHKRIFGDISEIDKIALNFSEDKLEPYLREEGYNFNTKTYENKIIFPTKQHFLKYYLSTSLFRMTTEKYEENFIIKEITKEVDNYFKTHDKFINRKKIRFVTIIK